MKPFSLLALTGLLALLPACTTSSPNLATQPVGPAPSAWTATPDAGRLIVYSDWDLFNDYKSPVNHRSAYTVSENGKTVRAVQNHVDRFDEGPEPVSLPAGNYQVTARSAHYGKVTVPVVIKTGQTTAIYLDGSPHPGEPADSQSNAVKLPNGQIIGWSANTAAN